MLEYASRSTLVLSLDYKRFESQQNPSYYTVWRHLTFVEVYIMPDLPPVRACIFDSDGLLINSEDIYTTTMNKVLHEYGLPDIPWTIKATQQSRGRQVERSSWRSAFPLNFNPSKQHRGS